MNQTRTEEGRFSHIEIHKCPFDGGETVVSEVLRKLPWGGVGGGGGFFVECSECGARGPHLRTHAEAISEWNAVFLK
jgi:hypothetical protein